LKSERDVLKCATKMKSVLTKLKAAQPEVVLISTYWKKNEEAEAFEVIDEIRDTISSDLVVFSHQLCTRNQFLA